MTRGVPVAGSGLERLAELVDGVDLPMPVLRDHPREDVSRSGALDVVAPDERILLARAAEVAAVGGLQPLLLNDWHAVDLTLRLRELRGADAGAASVVTSVRAWVVGRPEQATHPHDVTVIREAWRRAAPRSDTSAWEPVLAHLVRAPFTERTDLDQMLATERPPPAPTGPEPCPLP